IKANLIDIAKKAEGWTVPSALLGENAERWTRIQYRSGAGAIEHFLEKAPPTICISMPNLPLFLASRKFTDMEITSAWGEASSDQLKHILVTVRTRVLQFALDLGKEYPDAGSVKSAVPKDAERVKQLFINNIYGPANVVGTSSHSNIVL